MKKKKINRKTVWRLVFFFLFSIIVFALLCGLCTGYLWFATGIHGFSFPETYTYRIGMDSTKESQLKRTSYKMGALNDSGALYVNFSTMLDYCGFYESGNGKEFRYMIPGNGAQFTVSVGSSRVDINGNIIYMNAPAVYSEGDLYLPLEFVDRYIEGITVTVSTKTVKVTDEDGKTVGTKEVEIENTYDIRFNENNEYRLLLEPVSPTLPIDHSVID